MQTYQLLHVTENLHVPISIHQRKLHIHQMLFANQGCKEGMEVLGPGQNGIKNTGN